MNLPYIDSPATLTLSSFSTVRYRICGAVVYYFCVLVLRSLCSLSKRIINDLIKYFYSMCLRMHIQFYTLWTSLKVKIDHAESKFDSFKISILNINMHEDNFFIQIVYIYIFIRYYVKKKSCKVQHAVWPKYCAKNVYSNCRFSIFLACLQHLYVFIKA